MAEKKSSKNIQFALFGLCSLVALAVCMAVLVVTVRTVENSNSSVTEYETQSKTQLTDDVDVLLNYLNTLTSATVGDRFIKADTYTDIGVDDSSFIANSDQAKSLLVYAKNKMLGTVDGYYAEDKKGVFGTADNSLPVINLSADDIVEHSFSVGETEEDGDYYFITFTVDPASQQATELFGMNEDKAVADKFAADITSVCKINSVTAQPEELAITAKVNRITDELVYLYFAKNYTVEADVAFKGELEVFGSDKIGFKYTAEKKYEYAYAGIRFDGTTITVEPGSETALTVNAVIENDSEYTVTFVSSDESIATVDEMGYVKGISASEEPAIITVKLEYLGQTFTDECTVYIGTAEE